jgi:hypothetical protein
LNLQIFAFCKTPALSTPSINGNTLSALFDHGASSQSIKRLLFLNYLGLNVDRCWMAKAPVAVHRVKMLKVSWKSLRRDPGQARRCCCIRRIFASAPPFALIQQFIQAFTSQPTR